ncbi:ABC transporter permease [Spirochaetia bacterium]|nr:ABC transporter permease [Spirochaetia bacterium]
MFRRETIGTKLWLIFVYTFIICVVLLMTLPFVNILAVSFSNNTAVLQGRVRFWPVDFSLVTYKQVFKESQILLGLRNTILLTVVGTVINLTLTLLAAYPLSKSWLKGRSLILTLITVTMVFGAGMIPGYMLVSNLKLLNSFWALWLPGAMSTFNMIIMKSFIQSIPPSLEESAQLDGASGFRILLQIIIPLSLPSIATIALFYAVGWWNSYFNNMLYINTSRLTTLQIQLRDLLNMSNNNVFQTADTVDTARIAEESVKAVSIVIATVPILAVYPFLQKYFVKGVMVGSIKG